MGEAREEEDWPSTCEARAGEAVQAQSYALDTSTPKYSGVSGVSLISTRSAGFAAAHLSDTFRGMYLLHDVLTNLDSSLSELNMADSILIEAAPVYQASFDTHMLQLVRKVQNMGKDTTIMVFPSLRKKSNKAWWVHRWNLNPDVPFRFAQTCTCKVPLCQGQGVKDKCHFPVYVASSKTIELETCAEIPSLGGTKQMRMEITGVFFSFLLRALSPPSVRADVPSMFSASVVHSPPDASGVQQAPDSACCTR